MKTFNQFNESKELQERGSSMDMILSSPDLHGNHIEYHLGMLLGDLLAMMWKILKFILISAPIMAAKALHKRYNKEARTHRKQLKSLNNAIKQERIAKAKSIMLVAYSRANDMAVEEKKLLSELPEKQQKKYKSDIKAFNSTLDNIIDNCKKGIDAVKSRLKP